MEREVNQMEKFADVKNIENLIEMGDDAVIEFVNKILDMIDKHELAVGEMKSKFGFNITEAKNYLASKYATKDGRFIKKAKTCRKRRSKTQVEKPALTDKEILELKSMVANKLTVPVRSGSHCEFVVGSKDATMYMHVRKEFQDKFKEYCAKNRQFNQSEHMMLAVLEYIEKYK